jgi:IS30 family transposase
MLQMRKYKQISKEQRFKMDALLKEAISKSRIAEQLGVDRSTIYRELKRNQGNRGHYHASKADEIAAIRKERFSDHRRFTAAMKKLIDEKLKQQQWSPEQIVNHCRLQGTGMVSHERIYQYIYDDKRSGGSLYRHLRIGSKPYRKRYGSYDHRGKIPDRISIEQRPTIVEQRERVGDWEVDTILGPDKPAILTIIERKTLFTLLIKLDATKADLTRTKIINALSSYKPLVHTITSDNGHEFYEHKTIAEKLGAQYFFTHPYSAWEKGTCENNNGLIRQYIPKKTPLSTIDQIQLNLIAQKLNSRPRKKLGFKNPLQVFMATFQNLNTVALGS